MPAQLEYRKSPVERYREKGIALEDHILVRESRFCPRTTAREVQTSMYKDHDIVIFFHVQAEVRFSSLFLFYFVIYIILTQ